MNRNELLIKLIKSFLSDLSESVKPLSSEESIVFTGVLIEFLKGVYNSSPFNPEYPFIEREEFDEDEFIEMKLLIPFRQKMVPFIKTNLRLYFAKDEYEKTLLFKKLGIKEPLLNDEEYQEYVIRLFLILRKIKENLYLRPTESVNTEPENVRELMENTEDLSKEGFKSKPKEYTRIRQVLLFYYLSKLAGLSRLDASVRKYATFAHFLFYYPTENVDNSEIYKMLKQAPNLKEGKSLLKDLEFVKKQFEIIESAQGVDLVQKDIEEVRRKGR